MARRRRGFFSRSRRRAPRIRRVGRSIRRFHTRASGIGRRLTGSLPRWAKPSRIAAYTGVAVGIGQLVLSPVPNGSGGWDSWLNRIRSGYTTYQETKNPLDILGWDDVGNNATTIAMLQAQQNALPSIGTVVGFGIGAAVLSFFGM